MAVFFNTGGGDIYGGCSKEAVLSAIREDMGDDDFAAIKEEIYEVPGSMKIGGMDENGESTDETSTLEAEYDESLGSYCMASNNG